MIKALTWDRRQFEMIVGKSDQAAAKTVASWVDHQKLWGIHWMADFYVVTHLPSGKAVTRFGGGARKRTTAGTICAASTPLIDWWYTDPEQIGEDVALAQRLHQITTFFTAEETGSRFH